MSWNRPRSDSNTMPIKRKNSPFRWILACSSVLVVLVVALCLAFMFSSDKPRDVADSTSSRKIKEVQPQVRVAQSESLKKNVQTASFQKVEELTEEQRLLKGRDTNKWIVVTNPHTGKKFVSRYICPGRNLPPPLYKNGSLNIIDAIMFTDASDPMFGVQINKSFMAELQQALIEKIEITDDDTPEMRERKQAMSELLADFRARLKEGEDLTATIEDSLRERRNLCAFKEMMIQTRAEMRESGASEEEVAEFERACNKKLEEKGASPMLTREGLKKAAERRRLMKEGK